jgi:hypothetical protein
MERLKRDLFGQKILVGDFGGNGFSLDNFSGEALQLLDALRAA